MNNLAIGIYGDDNFGLSAYNIASGFISGIYQGFKKINENTFYINAKTYKDCKPQITLAVGNTYIDAWKYYIDNGAFHFIWSIDSLFRQQYIIDKILNINNLFVIGGSKIENNAINYFYPQLKFHYMPFATNEEVWCPDNSQKCYDIVLMSSLSDFESKIEIIRKDNPPAIFNIYMELLDLSLNNPELNFWNLYNYFVDMLKLNINDYNAFNNFLTNLVYVATHIRRVRMIKTLKDFNLKIWGSPLWEKYIEGNIEYMGQADFPYSLEVTRKAKIILNLQTMQGQIAVPDRVVNSMATGAFVLSDYNAELVKYFGNTIGYFDNVGMENLPDLVSYYLNNEEERENKAVNGRELVIQNHTWENRAKYILQTFFNLEV